MHRRHRAQAAGPQKARHALPPWFTSTTLDGKPGGILFKCGICLTEPSALNKLAYPATLLDDVSRPRIFDAHVFRVTGQTLWLPSDLTTRVEIHVEHGSIRFYRAVDVARYRVAKLRTEEPGSVEISKTTGMPLMFSIHADVMAYANVAAPAKADLQPAPLPLPLCLDLSLRDVTDVWFDQNSRALLRLRFQSGLSIAFACRAGDEFLTCVFHRLRVLSVYATSDEANVLKPLHEAARSLAAAVSAEAAHNASLPASRLAQRSAAGRGASLAAAAANAGALTVAELEASPYAEWTPAQFPRDSDDLAQAIAALDRLLADSDDDEDGGGGSGGAAPSSGGLSAGDYGAGEADEAAVRRSRSALAAERQAERARLLSELQIPEEPAQRDMETASGDELSESGSEPEPGMRAVAQPSAAPLTEEVDNSASAAVSDQVTPAPKLPAAPAAAQVQRPAESSTGAPAPAAADLDTAIAELIQSDPRRWRTAAPAAPAGRMAIDLPATVTRERGAAASAGRVLEGGSSHQK